MKALLEPILGFASAFEGRQLFKATTELESQGLQNPNDVKTSAVEPMDKLLDIQSDGVYN